MKIENALWDFAQAFYAQPNVSETLLTLQDNYGYRVNQLLFALWLAGIERHIISLEGAGDQWAEEVINPLREIRRAVKQQMQSDKLQEPLLACYKKLLVAEIATEQIELAHLHAQYLTTSEIVANGVSYPQLVSDNLLFCRRANNSPCLQGVEDNYWRELEMSAVQYYALKMTISDG